MSDSYPNFIQNHAVILMVLTCRLKGRNSGMTIIWRDIINSQSTVCLEALVGHLGNALETPIACLEVQISSPVVGEVLAKGTSRAGRHLDRIIFNGGHASVKGVSSADLMDMRGWIKSWVD